MAPSILFCFAHPDDESFCGVGTALKYRAQGVRSVLVTATRGERGKCGDPAVCTPGELPATRERELREAAAIGGIDEVHVLDYRDRELERTPPDEIRAVLVAHIRRVRPLVVVTFDPNGFNQHPDHVAIGRFATDAVAAAADPRWLRQAGEPHTVPRLLWTPPLAPWEAGKTADVHDHPGVDFAIDCGEWREQKAAALKAHRTQHLSIDRYFFNQPQREQILSLEIWRHGGGTPVGRRPVRDLLSGIGHGDSGGAMP